MQALTYPLPDTEFLVPSGEFRATLHCVNGGFRWARNNGDWISRRFVSENDANVFGETLKTTCPDDEKAKGAQ